MYDKDKHIELLKATNEALASRLIALNKRKMARNDEATNQWRRKAFYWKQKYNALFSIVKVKGGKTNEDSSR